MIQRYGKSQSFYVMQVEVRFETIDDARGKEDVVESMVEKVKRREQDYRR